MFDKNDILSRLQNGEDASAIANEFADMLNAVIQEKAEADAAAKEKNAKLNDTRALSETIFNYIKKWYPNLALDMDELPDDVAETVMAAFDDLAVELRPLINLSKKLTSGPVKVQVKAATSDPIADFLKRYGL